MMLKEYKETFSALSRYFYRWKVCDYSSLNLKDVLIFLGHYNGIVCLE